MIKYIHIKNFQSLEDVKLELGKLTVIVGASNAGKTAVLRAVRAAVENKRGDTFITDGTKECLVSIVDDKLNFASWYKPLKKSGIYYDSESSTINQYQALKIFGLNKVEISNSLSVYINFHNQQALPFLLAESDVTKSKVLGEITNANILLRSINSLKKLAINNNATLAIRINDLDAVKLRLQKYSILPDLHVGLSRVSQILENAQDDFQLVEKLSSLQLSIKRDVIRLNNLNRVAYRLRELKSELDNLYFSKELEADIKDVQDLTVIKANIQNEITIAKRIHKQIIVLEQQVPDITSVEEILNDLTVLIGYQKSIQQSISAQQFLKQEIQNTENELRLTEQQLDDMKMELKICPLCEAPLVAQ